MVPSKEAFEGITLDVRPLRGAVARNRCADPAEKIPLCLSASWSALYGLGVLSLALVVALGAFLEMRKLVTPVSYFAVASGTTFFLAVVASRSYEPFLATAFTG